MHAGRMNPPGAPTLLAAAHALPPHRVEQAALTRALSRLWPQVDMERLRVPALHDAVRVRTRHLALPLDRYGTLASFAEANRHYLDAAVSLGEEALRRALDAAGLGVGEVDQLVFVSSTGIATPSVDAMLVNRMSLPTAIRRTPIFGLGCAGGAAGLARAADGARAHPGELAALVAVELCSLTFQRDDRTVGNAIAAGLFADGAAAALVRVGEAGGAGPRIVASRSVLFPDTERVMGWDVVESGLRVNLSPWVAKVVRANVAQAVDDFLASQDLVRGAIDHWICHPGGPRVIEAVEEALELPAEQTERSWRILRDLGNLSSVSVLVVLAAALREMRPSPGERGLLLAMGPGFACELLLLEW